MHQVYWWMSLGFDNNMFFLSASGLTRHQASCLEPPSELSRSISFSCPSCGRKFGQKRYMEQHIGGKKCEQRKTFIERTTYFTLVLTGSPSSSHSTTRNMSTVSEMVSSCILSSNMTLITYTTSEMLSRSYRILGFIKHVWLAFTEYLS